MINKNMLNSMAIFIVGQIFLQLKLFTPTLLLISIISLFVNFFTIKYFIPKILYGNKFNKIKNILSNNLIYFLLLFVFISFYNSFPSNKISIYYSYILLQFLLVVLSNIIYFKEK